MRRDPGPREDQGGFAAVDALVAVTILSSSLALSLAAAQIGVRASRAATETRDADLILRERLARSTGHAGLWSGRDEGLDWRVEAQIVGVHPLGQAAPCTRTATARAIRTGRVYRITTVEICNPPADAEGRG